jgi:hypothetical protein
MSRKFVFKKTDNSNTPDNTSSSSLSTNLAKAPVVNAFFVPQSKASTNSLTPKPLIEKLLTSKENNNFGSNNSSNKVQSSIPFSSGPLKATQNVKVARQLINDSNTNTGNRNVSQLNSQIKISSFLTKAPNVSFKKPTSTMQNASVAHHVKPNVIFDEDECDEDFKFCNSPKAFSKQQQQSTINSNSASKNSTITNPTTLTASNAFTNLTNRNLNKSNSTKPVATVKPQM